MVDIQKTSVYILIRNQKTLICCTIVKTRLNFTGNRIYVWNFGTERICDTIYSPSSDKYRPTIILPALL